MFEVDNALLETLLERRVLLSLTKIHTSGSEQSFDLSVVCDTLSMQCNKPRRFIMIFDYYLIKLA